MTVPEQHQVDLSAGKGMAGDLLAFLERLYAAPYTFQEMKVTAAIDTPLLDSIDDILLRSLARVHGLRNRRASINYIPSEILARVFEFVRWLSTDKSKPKLEPCHWIVTSHVCRSWRDVALSYPPLWNSIKFDPESMDDEDSFPSRCLQRVGNTPLELTVAAERLGDPMLRSIPDSFREKLIGRCHRLKKLTVREWPLDYEMRSLSSSAPLLESLSIEGHLLLPEHPMFERSLATLFNGHTPSLKSLRLERVPSFNASQLGGAKLLHVRLQCLRFRSMNDLRGLLDLLRASPNLLHFSIHSTSLVSDQFTDLAPPRELIHMRALRELSFDACDPSVIAAIVARLEVPVEQNITVKCEFWQPAERTLSTIFPDGTHWRARVLQNANRLELDFTLFTITASAVGANSVVYLSMTHREAEERLEYMADLQAVLPFHALEELWLTVEQQRYFTREDLRQMLGSMPLLKRLFLVNNASLPHWLPVKALTGDGLVQGDMFPAPALDELNILVDIMFTDETVRHHQALQLVKIAKHRARRGHRLGKLHVMYFSVYRSGEKVLQAWDAQKKALAGFVDMVQVELTTDFPTMDIPHGCVTSWEL